jgi:SanA protein
MIFVLRISGLLLLIVILALFIPRLIALVYSYPRTYRQDTVPAGRVAIVFGAGLRRDGSPSPVLRDRVATAAAMYFSGKVEKLLMSGDNRTIYYNEPGAMREYALELGVPEGDIVLDYAGRRTYDTCYRAKAIFKLDDAILVTQQFHLPRALYTCNMLGLPAVGVKADRLDYFSRARLYWNLREIPATAVALWEIHVTKPVPVLGNPEPIYSEEAQ